MPIASQLRNFHELLGQAAQKYGEREFLPRRSPGEAGSTSFAELAAETREIAAGLLAKGIGKGDRLGLISENRAEWLACDLASASIGAVDVPRGIDTPPSELEFLLGHAGCRLCFTETPATTQAIGARRESLPLLQTIVQMTGDLRAAADASGPELLTLGELRAAGREHLAAHPQCIEQAAAQVGRDDLLTIIYTSGTTANPKGVQLSQGNLLANLQQVEETLEFDDRDVALSLLPSWHAYERIFDYILLQCGARLVYTDKRNVKADMAAVQPTILVAVPRIWEMIHDGMLGAVRKLSGTKRRLLDYILAAAPRRGAGEPTLLDRLTWPLLKGTLLPKLLTAATGGKVRLAVSGGGALPAHVDRRMVGLGLPLLNGYGLTETSPVLAVRQPENNRVGTIGTAVPNTEIQIRDDQGAVLGHGEQGVIWARGPQVMRGYHDNPEATATVLTEDGWFDTGDLGTIDQGGMIRITGRAKDTIVLAGGENVEPERVETALKTSTWIEQAVVVGQDEKSLGALLVIDQEHLEHDLPRAVWDLRDGEFHGDAVRQLIRKEIARLLGADLGFRPIERVATFTLLAGAMTPENGLLTQTLKVRRHVVHNRYATQITRMFGR